MSMAFPPQMNVPRRPFSYPPDKPEQGRAMLGERAALVNNHRPLSLTHADVAISRYLQRQVLHPYPGFEIRVASRHIGYLFRRLRVDGIDLELIWEINGCRLGQHVALSGEWVETPYYVDPGGFAGVRTRKIGGEDSFRLVMQMELVSEYIVDTTLTDFLFPGYDVTNTPMPANPLVAELLHLQNENRELKKAILMMKTTPSLDARTRAFVNQVVEG